MGCSPHTFICFLFISFIFMLPCAATNTLYPTQSITDGQKLVSTNNMFELVFFSPGESLNRYLGIRFGEIQQVWIANRENPVTITSGIFTIQDNGNLAVLAESKYVVWSTNVSTASNATIAVLLDNGNLVLKEGNSSANSGRVVWQSFDHPSNVLLPGMKIGMNLKTGENRMLKSWKDDSDPAPGNFAFGIDPDGLKQFFIWRRSVPYWRAVFWNGSGYDVMGNKYDSHVVPVNFSIFSNQDEVYFTNDSPTPKSTIKLLVMDAYGILHSMEAENQSSTSVEWLGTKDECSIIGGCGQFSSCNVNNRPVCKCLPGFEPNSKDPSTGCHRKTRYECGEEDGLLSLKRVEVPPPTWSVGTNDADECRKWCLSSDCNCRGTGFTVNGSSCYLWESKDFQDVREEDEEGQEGLLMDVYIRMSASDLKLIGRQCNYCGTNIIPYPLSTSPDCGDPDYGALICDASNGRLRFRSLNGTYAITSINPDTRTLVIKPEGIDICWARSANRSDIHLNSNQHFHVTGNNTILLFNCSTTEQSPLNCNSSSACYRYIREGRAPCFDLERCCSYIAGEMSNMVGVLNTGCNAYASIVNYNFSLPAYDWWEGVEIKWDAPLEPVCIVPEDCDAWPNSKCLPDKSMAERKRCFCNNKFHWDSLAMNCIPGNDNGKRPLLMIISITVVVCTLLSGTLVYCFWSKISKKKGDPRTSETLDVIMFGENGRKDVHVPFFDFEGILDATENFSESNKLGRGGFGPVYKGKFPGEQELAVKRLSTSSRQGQEEFKNEVVLIAKLQHRNLVRLLGYCIKGDERILLYEYMPNKSLDYLLFDQNRCQLLNWEKRYHIILGIARGLLYLHEDSRLRIIHRDLKTSNILLDEEMKPKISDFGLARIFGGNQIQENTNRVAGTYGYMSPEYAVHGLFSVKSDVFSFGVILLEIVSGMKNTLFHHPEQSLSLLGHAWQLWQEGKWMDLLDKNLHEAHDVCEVQMCIHIGLLCVQENTIDRPTMASVVAMFVHEAVTLQTPKEPAFIMRSLPNQVFSSDTRNDITFSTVEGR